MNAPLQDIPSDLDYSREKLLAERGSIVILRSSNPERSMSALGKSVVFGALVRCPLLPPQSVRDSDKSNGR